MIYIMNILSSPQRKKKRESFTKCSYAHWDKNTIWTILLIMYKHLHTGHRCIHTRIYVKPIVLFILSESCLVGGDACVTSLQTHVPHFLCVFPVLTQGMETCEQLGNLIESFEVDYPPFFTVSLGELTFYLLWIKRQPIWCIHACVATRQNPPTQRK